MSSPPLHLPDAERRRLWERLVDILEEHPRRIAAGRVAPTSTPEELRALLAAFDFETPLGAVEALDRVAESLERHQIHTPHPCYFGLFNPATTSASIAADTLVAAFNPQLATWGHSPYAVEVERHLVAAFAARFGLPAERHEGAFASGGAEANHTALSTALTRAFPEVARRGLRFLRAQPVLYVSGEGHDSIAKAARLCGLGTDAVREIPVDTSLRLDTERLRRTLGEDRARGLAPFMIVATAGTTAAGVIDPLPELADLAADERLWLHVDAAWGGAAVLVPELRPLVAGIERADSITFDAHKFLSVPMGAGLYLNRHPGLLERTFRVTAGYMPTVAGAEVVDPWANTMQWSRRFIGLKLFLSLAVAGWRGYEEAIRHQTAMGKRLRELLAADGWRVVNDTPLPVVCFVEADEEGASREAVRRVAEHVVASGRAWISTVNLGYGGPALRACITNYLTGPEDLEELVEALGAAREATRPALSG